MITLPLIAYFFIIIALSIVFIICICEVEGTQWTTWLLKHNNPKVNKNRLSDTLIKAHLLRLQDKCIERRSRHQVVLLNHVDHTSSAYTSTPRGCRRPKNHWRIGYTFNVKNIRTQAYYSRNSIIHTFISQQY